MLTGFSLSFSLLFSSRREQGGAVRNGRQELQRGGAGEG